uniref:Phosphomannomutase n=1 Tax=Candidatus Methanophaga sp. ANME-1 ERB7 TaxID=2759913 RepID=A0A7G9Z676_9EURY|nr:phosphomannomutase [Methanosarcinales archaeon ANME-1 ERB7]
MIVDKTAYRANDIRGIADTQLSDDFCTLAGLAYVELLRKHRGKEPQELRVVVGKDVRNSSPRLKTAFADALMSRGVHVIDIAPAEKVSSTPLMYFATWLFNADGGVEVTGSHLDKEWNGFKPCVGTESATEDQIRAMLQTAKQLEVGFKTRSGVKGELEVVDVLPDYHAMIVANVVLRERWEELALGALAGENTLKAALAIAEQELEKLPAAKREPLTGLRIAYDAGNGTTGVIAPQIFRDLGAEVFELYSEPDGNFPNHLPDPTIPRFLDDLHAEVARKNAHIGLASDCDGDRAGAISPTGKMIIGEQILALLCKHILKEHHHAKIVYDTKCSDAIREIIMENEGVPVEWKTGFSFIKSKMEELNAVAGGEMSGHVYFAKNNRADDAVFAFSELLLLTAKESETKSDVKVVDVLLEDFLKRYVNTPEIRIPVVSDEEKGRVCDAVEDYYRELATTNPELYKRRTDERGNDIDGVKIEFVKEKGWALVRHSNTSPMIILRMEARHEEGLRKIEEHVLSKFAEFKTVDLNADDYVRAIMQRVPNP